MPIREEIVSVEQSPPHRRNPEKGRRDTRPDRPAYWTVIPAAVRYDRALPPNAKLLYGEVAALAAKRGYCYARNSYFSALFGLSDRSVTRLLAVLARQGYLRIDILRDEKTNNVRERRIFPTCTQSAQGSGTAPVNFGGTPPDPNGDKNNTRRDAVPPVVPQGGQEGKTGRPAGDVPRRGLHGWHYEEIDGERVLVIDEPGD